MIRDIILTMPSTAISRMKAPSSQVGASSSASLHLAVTKRLTQLGLNNPTPAAADEETLRFDVQLLVLEKLLASEGGGWVRNVCQRTGAKIQVKHDPQAAGGKYYLEISGKPEQAVEAETLVEDAVRLLSMAAIADTADAFAAGGAAAGGAEMRPPVVTGPAPHSPGVPGATTLLRPPAPATSIFANASGIPGASVVSKAPGPGLSVSKAATLGKPSPTGFLPQPRPGPPPQQPAPEVAPATAVTAPLPQVVASRPVDPRLAAAIVPPAPAAVPAPPSLAPLPGPPPGPPPPSAPCAFTSPAPQMVPVMMVAQPPPPWGAQPPPPWATAGGPMLLPGLHPLHAAMQPLPPPPGGPPPAVP